MFDLTIGTCPFEFDSLSASYLKNLNFDEVCYDNFYLIIATRWHATDLKIFHSAILIFN